MNFNADQVPCGRAYAEQDDTKLLYLAPADLMLVFTIEQIDDIVEQAQNQNIITVETDSNLTLKSMLAEKKKDLARPRERVMT